MPDSETLFRGFLEAAPDAVVIVDEAGHIVHVNAQTERLFGYPRAELVGHSVDMLVPSRFREHHAKHRGGYFREARVRAMGSGLDLYGLRKDQTEFPVEISLSPIIRVLFMSGYTDDSIVRHGVLDSDVAFLQKPIIPPTLLLKVREVLDAPS